MPSIKKITLTISLLGIITLLILTNTLEPKLKNIEEITTKTLNKKVKVQGTIFNIRSIEDSNFQIISIKDNTGEIDITINEISNLTENQEITVIGRITDYNQYLQIEAEKISIP